MFKIFSLILVVFLLLSGCSEIVTTPTPETPPSTTQPDVNISDNYATYLCSNTDSLRVRNSPNSSSTTLGYLDKYDLVKYVGEDGDYYETVFREKRAYVHKSYVQKVDFEKSNPKVESAIEIGSSLLGYPYVFGSERYHWGNGKLNSNYIHGQYDCSALVQYAYYVSNKVILDVTTRTQVSNGSPVDKNDLKRGDLMFFTNASRKHLIGTERIGHVGIYFGDNYILHTASDHAVIEPISSTRWDYFITARRVV